MSIVDATGVYAWREDWECYSKTPDYIVDEVNDLIYAILTTNNDPVVAQKIIYDTLYKQYRKYGFRGSEGDQCTTNIINKYYGSDIDRWANLGLAAEKKGDNWAISIPEPSESKPKENKTMGLSAKTTQNLASALKEEVIDYIHKDERYVLFMQEIIPDAIREKLGNMDEEVLYELSTCVMDSMCLR
jgi:hypothetical protein